MISGFIARLRSLWRAVRRRDDVEAEISEEFRADLELRAEDLIRAGLPRDQPLGRLGSSSAARSSTRTRDVSPAG